MKIRSFAPGDLGALFTINQASTPGVGSEATAKGLKRWIDLSTCLIAAGNNDEPLGFITLIEPGTAAYNSANLRWFEAWQRKASCDLVYVDRIAVAADARANGVGEALYRAAFKVSMGREFIGAEVNTDPDNPGSHRFHRRLGFKEVGRKRYSPTYEVAYYVREI